MQIRSAIMMLSSLVLFAGVTACGGASQEAKGPESDPWSGYKGTYATVADPKAKAEPKTEAATGESPAEPVAEEKTEEAPAPVAAAPTPAEKPAKKAKAAKAPAKSAAPAAAPAKKKKK